MSYQQYQREHRRYLLGWFFTHWLLIFTSITAALLVSAVVVFLGVRWYVKWSVDSTAEELKQKLDSKPTMPAFPTPYPEKKK